MARVAVLGAGSWGTAFAKVVADAGSEVMLWARRAEVVDAIQRTRTNPGYLPDVVLPTSLHATGDPRVALVDADIVAKEQPTATVIACLDHDRAVMVQQACVTGYFRPYTNTDVVGCELAAGMGMGDNSIASIITRGLAETARLGVALGAEAATFAGLAGMGDLVATCCSPLSRNRTFGARLGGGDTLEQAQAGARGQVAEGVKSCSAITQLAASRGVEVPLADGVHRVCHDGLPAQVLAAELLGRSTKPE